MPCLLCPLEKSCLDLFLWALQLHRKIQPGAKDGQQYKILNAVPEPKEKKKKKDLMFCMKRFKSTSCISRISWHNGISLLVQVI